MERLEFNYRGVIFEADGYVENPDDPYFYLDAVYHAGVDMTEVLDRNCWQGMEDAVNKEHTDGEELQRFLNRNDL